MTAPNPTQAVDESPARLWRPSSTTSYVQLTNGVQVRYMDAGQGQPVVLLHPLRGQWDYFQWLITLLLDEGYRVLAFDLPGFGYSPLPAGVVPDEPFLRTSVMAFLEALAVRDAVLVGESIGGTLALTVAATVPDRVARVAAINPYDYGERFGGGVRRGVGGGSVGLFRLLGPFTPELRVWLRCLLASGLADPRRLPDALVAEYEAVGRQSGYRRGEALFYRYWRSWLAATELYGKVAAPVTLVYGDQDWSRLEERQARQQLLARVAPCTLTQAGHFLSLERPEQIAALVSGDVVAA